VCAAPGGVFFPTHQTPPGAAHTGGFGFIPAGLLIRLLFPFILLN